MTFTSISSSSEWKFSQVFGERSPGEAIENIDVISAIEFDTSGDYLAIGDRGGRIVIFEKNSSKNIMLGKRLAFSAFNLAKECTIGLLRFFCLKGINNLAWWYMHPKDLPENYTRSKLEKNDQIEKQPPKYKYKTEFQSHEPEFDYLKSLEIDEKINKVKWNVMSNGSLFILSANDRTIKLWKVKEHKVKKVSEVDLNPLVSSENSLMADRSYIDGQHNSSSANGYYLEHSEQIGNRKSVSYAGHTKVEDFFDSASAKCRKVYAHAHDFNINSISNNSDGETFLSADDLRINLWNLDTSDQCFNIIDMKPPNMEDLTEVITSAEFHPFHCNVLAYGSSRGFIRLVDMRQSALCDHHARIFRDAESHGVKSFFTEIIASVSDIKFAKDGTHLLSRDYMNLKLWDTRMEASPVVTYKIHEHLRPKLSDLYNSDAIFDKFDCCFSGDGLHFASGSYSNQLHIYSSGTGREEGVKVEVSKNPNKKPNPRRARRSSLSNLTRGFYRQEPETVSAEHDELSSDFSSKLQHVAWHPKQNLIACATGSSLFMFYA